MMNNYRKELDELHVDETFQKEMIQKLHQTQSSSKRKKCKRMRYALPCVLLCMVWLLISITPQKEVFQPTTKPNVKTKLDKIEVIPPYKGSNGLQSYVAIQPEQDFLTGNPWTIESKIKTLPVYRNGTIIDYQKNEIQEGGLQEEEMQSLAKYYAKSFALKTLIQESQNLTSHFYEYEEGRVMVERNGNVKIELDVDDVHIANEGTKQAALQVANRYKKQLHIKHPQVSVSTEYSSEKNANDFMQLTKYYTYSLYEKQSSLKKRIAAFNFERVDITIQGHDQSGDSLLENGTITIQIRGIVKGRTMGEYPIISVAQAKDKFYKGLYETNGSAPDYHEEIAHIELVYDVHESNSYLIPIYRIYAPIKNTSLYFPLMEGTYFGVYEVPAIEDAYLKRLN